MAENKINLFGKVTLSFASFYGFIYAKLNR